MFGKILLPTDGSRHSNEAASIAGEVAEKHGGTVHPVVAVEYQYIHAEDLPEEVAATIRERIDRRAQHALEAANERVRGAGGKTDGGRIVEGTPVEAILQEAEEGEYDLIVIGSRGVSLDSGHDRLMGSVTERVLHGTPCPVLVVRAEPRP
jgi:nucleotide-binding universal stress UspA family protein